MKKMLNLLIISLLLFSASITVNASDLGETFISSGYTSEGCYYEVYGEPISIPASALGRNTIYVERSVIFDGKISPPSNLDWSETKNGITYSGQLQLSHYTYFQNETTAYYKGNLSSD